MKKNKDLQTANFVVEYIQNQKGTYNLLNMPNPYTKKPLYTPKVILKIIGLTYMGWCTALVTFTIVGDMIFN